MLIALFTSSFSDGRRQPGPVRRVLISVGAGKPQVVKSYMCAARVNFEVFIDVIRSVFVVVMNDVGWRQCMAGIVNNKTMLRYAAAAIGKWMLWAINFLITTARGRFAAAPEVTGRALPAWSVTVNIANRISGKKSALLTSPGCDWRWSAAAAHAETVWVGKFFWLWKHRPWPAGSHGFYFNADTRVGAVIWR